MAKTTSSLDLNLVRLNRRKNLPLTTQLYDSQRQAIQTGQLPKGYRLPSTRELALQLSVSRTTVINAFDQLVAEGYLTSAVGHGTNVSLRLPEESLMATLQRKNKPRKTEVWPVRKKMSHSHIEQFRDTASKEYASHEFGTFCHRL